MRRIRLVSSTAAVTALVAVAAASAHTIGHGMTITASQSETPGGNDKFTGHITSSHQPCKANRLVAAYRAKSGPDQLFDSDRSGPGGYFAINPGRRAPQGTYYLTVARRALRNDASHSHYCRGIRTETFQIAPG